MKQGQGKLKGAAFERLICKKLSLWLSEGKSDTLLWRSAMSGGRSSIQLNQGIMNRNQAGDITGIDYRGLKLIDKFYIECKSYSDLKLQSLIFKAPKRNSILEFWNQTLEKAIEVNKEPMLIAKQNNYPILICLCDAANLCSHLIESYDLFWLAHYISLDLYLYDFDVFTSLVDPAILNIM